MSHTRLAKVRRNTVSLVLAAFAAVVAMASASAAEAATTIGQLPPGATDICSTGRTYLQASTGHAPVYTVPTGGGVITSWKTTDLQGGSTPAVTLKTLALVSGTTYKVTGTDVVRPVQSGTVTYPNAASPAAVRIPVAGGELLGFYVASSDNFYHCLFDAGDTGDVVRFGGGSDPGVGGAVDTSGISPAQGRLNASAVVEPDADRDGFGDESQDACLGAPGSGSGCLQADLGVRKTARQSPGAKRNVTYVISVSNAGPDAAPSVVVNDSLPVRQTLVSVSSTAGSCTGGPPVSCALGTLASGAGATITIVVKSKAGSSSNLATVSSAALVQAAGRATGAGDPNSSNNSSTATVVVALPAVSAVRARPSTWRLGSLLPRFTRRVRTGTVISFVLSERSTVKVEFLKSRSGRRVGRRCVRRSRSNARRPRCRRKIVAGRLSHVAHAGKNRLRFQGRLSKRRSLRPGRYTVRLTATDAAGNRSKPSRTRIKILARK